MKAKPKKRMPEKLMCEVCRKNEAVGVAGCTLSQPVSHAYCRDCLAHKADPKWCMFTVFDIVGLQNLAPWVKSVNTYHDGKYITFEKAKELYLQESKANA